MRSIASRKRERSSPSLLIFINSHTSCLPSLERHVCTVVRYVFTLHSSSQSFASKLLYSIPSHSPPPFQASVFHPISLPSSAPFTSSQLLTSNIIVLILGFTCINTQQSQYVITQEYAPDANCNPYLLTITIINPVGCVETGYGWNYYECGRYER